MIMDKLGEFGDAHTIPTSATGTYLLPNQVDLSVARDVGSGKPIYLGITVDTAIASTGNATVQFKLVSDGSASISTTGGASEHWASAAIAKATLVAGYKLMIPLPLEGIDYERYLGVLAIVGTAKLNAGKVNAFLTADPHKIEYYADAVAQATT